MQMPFEDQTMALDFDNPEPDDDSAQGRRRARFAARAALWRASSLRGLRWCGRFPGQSPTEASDWVGVKKGVASAGYSGLCACGSVWACPRCSAMIAMTRSLEIGRAVEEVQKQDGAAYLMTLTMRHHAGHGLDELWNGLSAGWRRVFGGEEWTGRKERVRSTRKGQIRVIPMVEGQRDKFGVAGTIRCVESTYGVPERGGRGWHLHAHVLVIVEKRLHWYDLWQVASGMFMRWAEGVENSGLPRPSGEGFDFRVVEDGGADFIGRYLSKATLDVAARIGAEVGGGRNTKQSRSSVNVTPFEMLHELTAGDRPVKFAWSPRRGQVQQWSQEHGLELVQIDQSVDQGKIFEIRPPGLWGRWLEWEQCSKGRRQILWSQRVKEPKSSREELWNAVLDARGREVTDEEIAARDVDGVLIAQIEATQFYEELSWKPDLMCALLEVIEQASDLDAARLVAVKWGQDHGVRVKSFYNPKSTMARPN